MADTTHEISEFSRPNPTRGWTRPESNSELTKTAFQFQTGKKYIYIIMIICIIVIAIVRYLTWQI